MSSDSEPEVVDGKSEDGDEGKDNDLTNSDIVTKYRFAAEVANRALKGVLDQLAAGKTTTALCEFGDKLIEGQCATSFKSKKITKGVAFPTCVSVNEVICHNSPLASEEAVELKEGDVVRVDLGAHIDGYIAQAATTVVVRADGATDKVEGELADAVVGTHTGLEVALRMCKPGATNSQVTAAISKVAEQFGLKPVMGTLSHQIKRFVIDGNNVILQEEDAENKVDEFEFEEGDAFTLDVCFTTGADGRPRETGARTTVFKRSVDETYRLKMKASRYVLNEVTKRFPTMPFTVRSMEDERQARMGVVECVKHNLLQEFPVLCERPEAFVGHFKATFLILSTGTVKISGGELADYFQSTKTVDEETAKLLRAGGGKRRRRKKKGGSGGGAGGASA